jgi:hypothetical protein
MIVAMMLLRGELGSVRLGRELKASMDLFDWWVKAVWIQQLEARSVIVHRDAECIAKLEFLVAVHARAAPERASAAGGKGSVTKTRCIVDADNDRCHYHCYISIIYGPPSLCSTPATTVVPRTRFPLSISPG